MGDGYDELHDNMLALEHELTTSVLQGGAGFCGVTNESFAINGVVHHWRKGSKLKIALDFDDLGQLRSSQVKEAIEAAVNEIRATTDGLTFELFTPTLSANLVCKLARLDGPSGVLADCQVPMPNANPANTQLTMRIDTGEVWRLFAGSMNGAIDFQRVWLHEFLHGIGLGHKPASISKPALIAPMYSPAIRNLQEADKGEITRRYGGRTTPIAPTPPVVPAPATGIQGEIKITLNGETWSAAGALKKQVAQAIYVDRYPTGPIIPPPFVEQDELADTDLEPGELS
jgi:hypothetical protein